MGVLQKTKDKAGSRTIQLSKGATERAAENMVMAVEAHRQEFLEVIVLQ